MLQKFEKSLTKYLVQVPKSRSFISDLDKSIFEGDDSKFLFSLVKDYYLKYNASPSKVNLIQYFDKICTKQSIDSKTKKYYVKQIKKLYLPLIDSDLAYLEENLFNFVKRIKLKTLVTDIATEVNSATSTDVDKWFYEFRNINNLQNQVQLYEDSDSVYITDYKVRREKDHDVIPSFLNGLNKLTAVGGFYTPQLIVILAPMKGFKTGTLINLAVNFMIDGYKVYYADTENGRLLTERRIYQTILECSAVDIINKKYEKELKNILKQIKQGGGEIVYDYFPPSVSTLTDVREKLDFHFEKTGFKPQIFIYDYLDKFTPSDKRKNNTTWEDINKVYEETVALNNDLGAFSFTQSQLQASKLKKKVTELGDTGGAISKMSNCHAAFAINQTKEEEELGIARMVVVAQRDGVRPGNYFYISIDYKKNKMYEIEQNKEEKKKVTKKEK